VNSVLAFCGIVVQLLIFGLRNEVLLRKFGILKCLEELILLTLAHQA
jgi:hypothetical protein